MLKNSITSKIVSGVVGISMLAMAMPVGAQTQSVADLTAQINSLLATIASLQSQLATIQGQGGTAAPASFTADLTIGAKGAQVTALQQFLVSKGFLTMPAGVAMGYFGTLTKDAVAKYQVAKGIAPAAGYWGPKTRAIANGEGAVVNPGTGTTGTTTPVVLQGGEGSLDSYKVLGSPSSEEVKAGQTDKVFGFEVKASDSDVKIDRVDAQFTAQATVKQQRPWYYADSVSLYAGDTKIATVDASSKDNWSDEGSGVYRIRFSSLSSVIKEGTKQQFYVAVTAKDTLDADIMPQSFTVKVGTDGVRGVDAAGINQYAGNSDTSTFSFVKATTGSLAVSKSSDSPVAAVVKASDTDKTNNVPLLTFKAKATDSDITIDTIPVTVSASVGNVSAAVATVRLFKGSSEIGSETVAATGATSTVTFDNLDLSVPQDSTATFTVKVDVNKIGTGGMAEGTKVMATTTGAVMTVEDANGKTVTATGSATGDMMTFRTAGVDVSLLSASTGNVVVGTLAGNGDRADYTIKFRVNAFGDDDVLINANTATSTATGTQYALSNESSISTVGSLAASGSETGDVLDQYYVVPAGESRDFTLTVTGTARGTANTPVQHRMSIVSIGWGTSTVNQTYSSNLTDFHTDNVSLMVH